MPCYFERSPRLALLFREESKACLAISRGVRGLPCRDKMLFSGKASFGPLSGKASFGLLSGKASFGLLSGKASFGLLSHQSPVTSHQSPFCPSHFTAIGGAVEDEEVMGFGGGGGQFVGVENDFAVPPKGGGVGIIEGGAVLLAEAWAEEGAICCDEAG